MFETNLNDEDFEGFNVRQCKMTKDIVNVCNSNELPRIDTKTLER